MSSSTRRFPSWAYVLTALGVMLLTAIVEHAMGRVAICKCGVIRFWVGSVNSAENSQQIADWYSFSHVIHGMALYAATRLIGRGKWSLGACLLLAIGLEASWEVLENTPFVINRYRQTNAVDYDGDSILNSMCDIGCCAVGFFLARALPVWASLSLIAVLELWVGWAIRDNLALNIIMLIHPFESIRQWQMHRSALAPELVRVALLLRR